MLKQRWHSIDKIHISVVYMFFLSKRVVKQLAKNYTIIIRQLYNCIFYYRKWQKEWSDMA